MKTLLIDGDALIYKIAFTSEHSMNWADVGCPELWTYWADENEAWSRMDRALSALMETHGADKFLMLLSDDRNYRMDILPTYKGNRQVTRHKPILHGRLRERVMEEMEFMMKPHLEADDLMGIIATAGDRIVKGEKLIVTDDKDLLTVPAAQIHFEGSPKEVCTPTKLEADRWFMRQTLTGDTVDNYTGCPGFGAVSAEKVLAKFDGDLPKFWREVVVPAYEKKGLTEDDALVQARCARILQFEDFDYKKQEVILWAP